MRCWGDEDGVRMVNYNFDDAIKSSYPMRYLTWKCCSSTYTDATSTGTSFRSEDDDEYIVLRVIDKERRMR